MKIDAELKGVNDAIARVKQYKTGRRVKCADILTNTAYKIESQAKALTPVSHGNLKNSIHSDVDEAELVADIGTNVEYAPYVEWGTGIYSTKPGGRTTPWVYYSEELGRFVYTRGMRAQPYLHPAWKMNQRSYVNDIKKVFGDKI